MRISDWSSDVCSSDLFAGRERLVDEQDSRVRTMISHLSTGLAEVEAQVAALGDAGVVQTEQLGVSVSQLKEALNSISQPLSDSDTGTDRKSVVKGKSVSVRVDLGGRRVINKKT